MNALVRVAVIVALFASTRVSEAQPLGIDALSPINEEQVALRGFDLLARSIGESSELFARQMDDFNDILRQTPEDVSHVLDHITHKSIERASVAAGMTIDKAELSFQSNFVDIRDSIHRAMLQIHMHGLRNEAALIEILRSIEFTPKFVKPRFGLGAEKVNVKWKDNAVQEVLLDENATATITGFGFRRRNDDEHRQYKVELLNGNQDVRVAVPNGYSILGIRGEYQLQIANVTDVFRNSLSREDRWLRISYPGSTTVWTMSIDHKDVVPELKIDSFRYSAEIGGDDKDKEIQFNYYIVPAKFEVPPNTDPSDAAGQSSVVDVVTHGYDSNAEPWDDWTGPHKVPTHPSPKQDVLLSEINSYALVVIYGCIGADGPNDGPGVNVRFTVEAVYQDQGKTKVVKLMKYDGNEGYIQMGDNGSYAPQKFPFTYQ